MKFYFIGIKGTGMSSLALFLKQKGHEVRGVDTKDYIFTEERLLKENITIDSFDKMEYQNFDYVILGNSFLDTKIDHKKVITYPKLLSKIIKEYTSIAVSGTHGKTTTCTFISQMLDCNSVIGDGSSLVKDSPYLVFEACEYQETFLNYFPNYLVITNIDYDHVDYYRTSLDYQNSFQKFISQAKDKVIVNGDDSILEKLPHSFSFGLKDNNDLQAKKVIYDKKGIKFDLYIYGKYINTYQLSIYGKHNLYNVLASLSVSYLLENKTTIKKLKLPKRRFSEYKFKDNIFIDDYGHHPTEISSTIEAIKQKYPNNKIILIFKPDRYSRIEKFGNDFVNAFKKVNQTYLLPFPSCSKKEKGIEIEDDYLLKLDNSIKMLNDYSVFKNHKNYIFLMSSSKNVNTIKEKIIKEME